MKYIDFYNMIENPLENTELLDKLAEVYAKSKRGYNGFYSELINMYEKDYIAQYLPSAQDQFYATAFNKWKQGILSLTKDEFIALRERGSFNNNLIKLRKFLMTVPDVTTAQEVRKIISHRFEDEDLNDAMEDYYWGNVGFGSGWKHVKSRYLNGKRGYDIDVQHRLYLNLESIDTYVVAYEIMKKCEEHNLPFYFKFDEYGDRDDTLVVYSDTERLPIYINILEEIAKEHPEIKQRAKHPPILSGQVNGWIGYGAEPDVERESFNSLRSKCIYDAIDSSYLEWLKLNKNRKVKFQGQIISVIDFVSKYATMVKVQEMREILSRCSQVSQHDYEKGLGYSEKDLRNQDFLNALQLKIRESLVSYIDNPEQDPKSVAFTYGNSEMKLYSNDIKSLAKASLPYVMKSDLEFRKRVMSRIKKLSEEKGIDITRYCFDKSSREMFELQDEENQTLNAIYRNISNAAFKHGIKEPRAKDFYETNQSYIDYLTEFVKVNGLKPEKKKSPVTEPKTSEEVKSSTAATFGMTDEEIKASQIKLGFISSDITSDTTYGLTQGHIIQDLPITSSKETRYEGAMTDDEIIAAQKKIGTYRPTKKGK